MLELDAADYLPTLAEIRRECERIRATWSPAEREKRAGSNGNPPVEGKAVAARMVGGSAVFEQVWPRGLE